MKNTIKIDVSCGAIQEFFDEGDKNIEVLDFSWSQYNKKPDISVDVRNDMSYELDLLEVEEYCRVRGERDALIAINKEQDDQIVDLVCHIDAMYEDMADMAAQIAKLQEELAEPKTKKSFSFWK